MTWLAYSPENLLFTFWGKCCRSVDSIFHLHQTGRSFLARLYESTGRAIAVTPVLRSVFFPSQFFPWGKNGPARFFPGEKTD